MKTTVYVTAKDIKKGRILDETYCPVALAIGRATGLYVQVTGDEVYFGNEGYNCIDLPDKVAAFIDDFDKGRRSKCKPFRFNIDY